MSRDMYQIQNRLPHLGPFFQAQVNVNLEDNINRFQKLPHSRFTLTVTLIHDRKQHCMRFLKQHTHLLFTTTNSVICLKT